MQLFFFFNDTATTEIYTLSLHDALPIWPVLKSATRIRAGSTSSRSTVPETTAPPATTAAIGASASDSLPNRSAKRSEEHTSELQSRQYLVCRLLLEKKKIITHRVQSQIR